MKIQLHLLKGSAFAASVFSGMACIYLFAVTSVYAGQPLTLKDCLNLAFENSRQIKISDLSMKQASEKYLEAQAQRWPSVNLNGVYTRVGKVTSFTIPMGGMEQTFRFGTSNRMNFDAKLQLPVFTWGRISGTIAISDIGKGISNTLDKQQRVNLTEQVIRAYYSVLLNRKVIQLDQENYERAQKFMKITEERFSAGGIPRLELLRGEVQLQNSLSQLEDASGNLRKSRLFLANTLGIDTTGVKVEGIFASRPFEVNEQAVIDKALQTRSDLNLLQLQNKINNEQISVSRSGNKPNVILFSGYNVQNGFDPINPDKFIDNWNAGVQIAFPFFDGFATSHKVQSAKLEVQKTRLQETEIRDLIILQIRQAITTLNQAEEKISSQEENIKLAAQALQVAEEQYRMGVASSLDVLNAQQTLSQSEMMHTQAIFNHIMSKLELSRAMEDFSWFEADLQ